MLTECYVHVISDTNDYENNNFHKEFHSFLLPERVHISRLMGNENELSSKYINYFHQNDYKVYVERLTM